MAGSIDHGNQWRGSKMDIEDRIHAAVEAAAERARAQFESMAVHPTDDALAYAALDDPAINSLMDDAEVMEFVGLDVMEDVAASIPAPGRYETQEAYVARLLAATRERIRAWSERMRAVGKA